MINQPNSDLSSSQPSANIRSARPLLAQSLSWITPLHRIGYGLLLLSFLNLIDLVIPAEFMNPQWELQTLGAIVEMSPMMLVALVVVFLVDRNSLEKGEKRFLKFLSWLTLIIGIFYLLLVPLGLVNTARIDSQNKQQIAAQVEQVEAQIQQIKQSVSNAKTPEQMQLVVRSLNSSLSQVGVTSKITDQKQVSDLQKKLSASIAEGEQQMYTQVAANQSRQFLRLIKKSVKWNMGALVVGVLFISIWKGTTWTRKPIS